MVKNIDWATKVTLCKQGMATENRELQSYRTLFIALEAILFTAVSTILRENPWGVVVAFLGLMLTILWWHVCDLRGDAVDRWGDALANLWDEANKWQETVKSKLFPLNPAELYKHYMGATERREKKLEWEKAGAKIGAKIGGRIGEGILGKIGRKIAVSFGWGGCRRFISARWVFNTLIPLIVFIAWIVVIREMILCVFGC
jgi:hypothetical protein